MTVNFTIELSEPQKVRLEELAEHHGVSVAKLVVESAERILEDDAAYLAAVQKGIDEINAGRFFTHEEVLERSAKRREELLARAAQK